MKEKVPTLEVAVREHVHDGDVVALQNMATQAAPMATVREIIRQEKRRLGLVVLVGGIAVDWLAAAGCLDRLIGAAVSMEQFGLCQQYRAAVQAQQIRVEELSETALNGRLGAGARNLPFLPTRGMIGTDLIDAASESLVMIEDPFGGPPVVACRSLVPDVALVHVHRADKYGNAQLEPTAQWPDLGIMPKAAKKVIVTAEEIVDTDVLRRNPDRTVLPGFIVSAVVEVQYGAHPTSFNPNYGYDTQMHLDWLAASSDDDKTKQFLDDYVFAPSDQAGYLDSIGGAERLMSVSQWENRR